MLNKSPQYCEFQDDEIEKHLSTMKNEISALSESKSENTSLYEDALNAWDAFQKDGLHLTHAEADAWLARLEAGEDADIPVCHK